MTKEQKLQWQRNRRSENNNSWTKKYEKTENGFLMRLYRNMKSRVLGIHKPKYHLYAGKELLSKEDFYHWAKVETHDKFIELFTEYKNSGYDRKLTPTVDRINSQYGYTKENMRWLTHSENSKLGAIKK